MNEWEGLVLRANEPDKDSNVFTEEALAANDGEIVPLTMQPGGPIIGEVTLKYDSEAKVLFGRFQVDDPKVAEFLKKAPPNIFG